MEQTSTLSFNWRAYYNLCKPKVVLLIVFTAIVGMFLSVPAMVPLSALFYGSLGIGLAAASAAAINHIVDQKADALMARTEKRPIPTGELTDSQALIFAISLGIIAMIILVVWVNWLTAIFTFASLIGYAVVYTMYLKRATPQNIVIGGVAGAAPPVLGWMAVTNELHHHALLLFLIIFVWTPPHFWALAIKRREEYAKVGIPMLPVTHGVAFTKLQILLYTLLLFAVTLLPFATQMSGWIYFISAIVLGLIFLRYVVMLYQAENDEHAMKTFAYSITYLSALFAMLLVDHYFFIGVSI